MPCVYIWFNEYSFECLWKSLGEMWKSRRAKWNLKRGRLVITFQIRFVTVCKVRRDKVKNCWQGEVENFCGIKLEFYGAITATWNVKAHRKEICFARMRCEKSERSKKWNQKQWKLINYPTIVKCVLRNKTIMNNFRDVHGKLLWKIYLNGGRQTTSAKKASMITTEA